MIVPQDMGSVRFGVGGLASEQIHDFYATSVKKNTPAAVQGESFHQMMMGGLAAEQVAETVTAGYNTPVPPPPQRFQLPGAALWGEEGGLDRDSNCNLPQKPLEPSLLNDLTNMITGLFGGQAAAQGQPCPPAEETAASPAEPPTVGGLAASQSGEEVISLPRPDPVPLRKTPYDRIIQRAAQTHDVHEGLIRAVIAEESRFNPQARSREGAMGLMQLMPRTAQELGVKKPFSPEDNVMGGTLYLSRLLDRYEGNVPLALAAYNWGPTNLEENPRHIPKTTQRYVANVLSRLDQYGETSNT